MPNLLAYDEYVNLKSQGLTAKEISCLRGQQCPVAYASVMSNCKWVSEKSLIYKGVEFSSEMFKYVPSYSAIARKYGINRSLVFYIGHLLGAKISRAESCKFSSRILKPSLSSLQRQIIIGSLLGDGTIDKSYQFKVTHSAKQTEYTTWMYGKLKNICTSPPIRSVKRIGTRDYTLYRLSSYVLDETEKLRNEFYPQDRKTVPEKILYEMTDLALAVWYMDDGGTRWYQTHKGKKGIAHIYSLGFSDHEHDILINWFRSKWGLNAKKLRHNAGSKIFLGFSVKESSKLFEILLPHVCTEMLYKVYNTDG